MDQPTSDRHGQTPEEAVTAIRTVAGAQPEARLLACGRCYEENGAEVHPHPECPYTSAGLPTPSGCRYCGDEPGHHGSQWVASAGLHTWEQPTQEQIKARMLARHTARVAAGAQQPEPDGSDLAALSALTGGTPEALIRVGVTDDRRETQHDVRPRRGDDFEQWLKGQRDRYDRHSESSEFWHEFDAALDTYRLHADTGTPLGEHVCEGQADGDCECLEQQPAPGPQQPEERRGGETLRERMEREQPEVMQKAREDLRRERYAVAMGLGSEYPQSTVSRFAAAVMALADEELRAQAFATARQLGELAREVSGLRAELGQARADAEAWEATAYRHAELWRAEQARNSDLYFCPTVAEIESRTRGGFDSCCAHPDRHVAVPDVPGVQAISEFLSAQARGTTGQDTTPADGEQELRQQIAAAIHKAGAYCGECNFEDDSATCPDCARVRGWYVAAVLPVVQAAVAAGVRRALEDAAGEVPDVSRWGMRQWLRARAAAVTPPARDHGIGCAHVHTYLGQGCPGVPSPAPKQDGPTA